MFAKRYKAEELIDIIAAPSYNPDLLKYIDKTKNGPSLGQFLSAKPRLGITGTIAKDYVSSETKYAVPYFTTKQVGENLYADTSECKYISREADINWAHCRVPNGIIIINKSGRVGAAAIVNSGKYEYVNSVSDIINIRLCENSTLDKGFLVVYLNNIYGQSQLIRLCGGAIFDHVSLHEIPCIKLPEIGLVAQTYIGNKVRAAELLRERAKQLHEEIQSKIRNEELDSAVTTILKKFNYASTEDLYPRLDPKYYGNRALKVLKASEKDGVQIKSLIESVCNGFEERQFVENGIDYITVSEVSSGRLNLSTSPRISNDTEIPPKAYINEKNVLIVRTGSIGTAIKVDKRDSGSVISSHLIKLEFESESLATAVALFLNSDAGKVLQNKISYGAVQPQIGQDELLALWVPQFVINKQEALMRLHFKYEDAVRTAIALTQTSKYLIESLIEDIIPEALLIDAQHDLDDGDNSKDKAILSKLTEKGYLAKDGKPLFTDLDKLYGLLDEAQNAIDDDSSDNAEVIV
jgi:type I restriction enzyme S subunit